MNKIDWRLLLASLLTIGYLALLSIYVADTVGFRNLPTVSIERLGNFLEGAFAPIAFLWLVVGYFLQQKELAQNTRAIQLQNQEIKKTAEQAVRQSEAILKSEEHQRRESFLHISDIVMRQLATITSYLYLSSQAAGVNFLTDEDVESLFERSRESKGETFIFEMLRMLALSGPIYSYKLLYGTEIRRRHTEEFLTVYERLSKEARIVDPSEMIIDSLNGTVVGRLNKVILDITASPPEGFTIGQYDFDPDDLEGEEHPRQAHFSNVNLNRI